MTLSNREQNRLERSLAEHLTDACETAKHELAGFAWLTHEVDYARFPQSLQVTWIFTDEAHQHAAPQARLLSLTRQALAAAGIDAGAVQAPLHLDNEAACARIDGGDWQRRLARQLARRH